MVGGVKKKATRDTAERQVDDRAFNPTQEISFTSLAATMNCSTRTLQIMIDGGYIIKSKSGGYQLNTAVQGAMRYKSDHGTKKGATKEAAASRVQEARAIQIEQETALAAKELISISEHVAIVDIVVGTVRDMYNSLSARYTRDREERAKLTRLCEQDMKGLSDKWARLAKSAEDEAANEDEE
jgi:hypothetical protein